MYSLKTKQIQFANGTPTFIKALGVGELSVSGQFHSGLQAYTAEGLVASHISGSRYFVGRQWAETSGGQPHIV